LVDFGASEIGYSSGQADQSPPSSFNYQYLPDIAGATCLDYNLTDTVGNTIRTLKLSSSVLVGIFSGTITYWDDPAIKALNAGVLLPHNPIVVVYRSDASGDNFIFSNYLNTLQSAAWSAFTSATGNPAGAQAIWPTAPSGERSVGPYSFGNWTSAGGSDTASDYVFSNPNTITYVETGYANLHKNPCAQVQNNSGTFLAPSEAADAVALQNDVLQPDLEQNLSPVFESPQAGAYPISAYSYLVMAEQSEIPSSKQAVEAQYVQFIACDGQKAAGVLGYSPLPPNLVQADFDAVQRITGVAIPAPTASNCGDPYLTGSFNVAGTGSGPVISNSPTSGAPTGGAAANPVAASAAKVANASGTAGGVASGSSGSAGSAGTQAGASTTASGVSAGSSAVATVSHSKKPLTQAAAGQEAGVAMGTTAKEFLGLPGPSLVVVISTLLFIALLVTPPLIGLLRKRARSGDDEGAPT
jgi:ABC-type phosphate transport system substrate-binding protein